MSHAGHGRSISAAGRPSPPQEQFRRKKDADAWLARVTGLERSSFDAYERLIDEIEGCRNRIGKELDTAGLRHPAAAVLLVVLMGQGAWLSDRFEAIGGRFETIDERLDQIELRLGRLEQGQAEIMRLLQEAR